MDNADDGDDEICGDIKQDGKVLVDLNVGKEELFLRVWRMLRVVDNDRGGPAARSNDDSENDDDGGDDSDAQQLPFRQMNEELATMAKISR